MTAYFWAVKNINRARQNNDYKALYPIFVQLIIGRIGVDFVDLEYIFLCKTGEKKVAEIDYRLWEDFCVAIAALYFAKADEDPEQPLTLTVWQDALAWVDRLRKGGF